ncbi:hypothetical protein BJ742DRAFT_884449 [Cladochytrium replicatum]|nr:hypothetical protein BJ742DRAFT_884449 [Cladochytrium replicatum]
MSFTSQIRSLPEFGAASSFKNLRDHRRAISDSENVTQDTKQPWRFRYSSSTASSPRIRRRSHLLVDSGRILAAPHCTTPKGRSVIMVGPRVCEAEARMALDDISWSSGKEKDSPRRRSPSEYDLPAGLTARSKSESLSPTLPRSKDWRSGEGRFVGGKPTPDTYSTLMSEAGSLGLNETTYEQQSKRSRTSTINSTSAINDGANEVDFKISGGVKITRTQRLRKLALDKKSAAMAASAAPEPRIPKRWKEYTDLGTSAHFSSQREETLCFQKKPSSPVGKSHRSTIDVESPRTVVGTPMSAVPDPETFLEKLRRRSGSQKAWEPSDHNDDCSGQYSSSSEETKRRSNKVRHSILKKPNRRDAKRFRFGNERRSSRKNESSSSSSDYVDDHLDKRKRKMFMQKETISSSHFQEIATVLTHLLDEVKTLSAYRKLMTAELDDLRQQQSKSTVWKDLEEVRSQLRQLNAFGESQKKSAREINKLSVITSGQETVVNDLGNRMDAIEKEIVALKQTVKTIGKRGQGTNSDVLLFGDSLKDALDAEIYAMRMEVDGVTKMYKGMIQMTVSKEEMSRALDSGLKSLKSELESLARDQKQDHRQYSLEVHTAIESLKVEFTSLMEECNSVGNMYKRMEKTVQKVEKNQDDLLADGLLGFVGQLDAELKSVKQDIGTLNITCKTFERSLSRRSSGMTLEAFSSINSTVSSLSAEVNAIKTELSAVSKSHKSVERSVQKKEKQQLQGSEQALDSLEIDLGKVKQEVASLQKNSKLLENAYLETDGEVATLKQDISAVLKTQRSFEKSLKRRICQQISPGTAEAFEGLADALSGEMKALHEEMDNITQAHAALERSIRQLGQQNQPVAPDMSSISRNLETLDCKVNALDQDFEVLKHSNRTIESRVQRLAQGTRDISAADATSGDIEEMQQEIISLSRTCQKLERSFQNVEKQLQRGSGDSINLNNAFRELNVSVTSLKHEVSATQRTCNQLEKRIRERHTSTSIENTKDVDSQLSVIRSDIETIRNECGEIALVMVGHEQEGGDGLVGQLASLSADLNAIKKQSSHTQVAQKHIDEEIAYLRATLLELEDSRSKDMKELLSAWENHKAVIEAQIIRLCEEIEIRCPVVAGAESRHSRAASSQGSVMPKILLTNSSAEFQTILLDKARQMSLQEEGKAVHPSRIISSSRGVADRSQSTLTKVAEQAVSKSISQTLVKRKTESAEKLRMHSPPPPSTSGESDVSASIGHQRSRFGSAEAALTKGEGHASEVRRWRSATTAFSTQRDHSPSGSSVNTRGDSIPTKLGQLIDQLKHSRESQERNDQQPTAIHDHSLGKGSNSVKGSRRDVSAAVSAKNNLNSRATSVSPVAEQTTSIPPFSARKALLDSISGSEAKQEGTERTAERSSAVRRPSLTGAHSLSALLTTDRRASPKLKVASSSLGLSSSSPKSTASPASNSSMTATLGNSSTGNRPSVIETRKDPNARSITLETNSATRKAVVSKEGGEGKVCGSSPNVSSSDRFERRIELLGDSSGKNRKVVGSTLDFRINRTPINTITPLTINTSNRASPVEKSHISHEDRVASVLSSTRNISQASKSNIKEEQPSPSSIAAHRTVNHSESMNPRVAGAVSQKVLGSTPNIRASLGLPSKTDRTVARSSMDMTGKREWNGSGSGRSGGDRQTRSVSPTGKESVASSRSASSSAYVNQDVLNQAADRGASNSGEDVGRRTSTAPRSSGAGSKSLLRKAIETSVGRSRSVSGSSASNC